MIFNIHNIIFFPQKNDFNSFNITILIYKQSKSFHITTIWTPTSISNSTEISIHSLSLKFIFTNIFFFLLIYHHSIRLISQKKKKKTTSKISLFYNIIRTLFVESIEFVFSLFIWFFYNISFFLIFLIWRFQTSKKISQSASLIHQRNYIKGILSFLKWAGFQQLFKVKRVLYFLSSDSIHI